MISQLQEKFKVSKPLMFLVSCAINVYYWMISCVIFHTNWMSMHTCRVMRLAPKVRKKACDKENLSHWNCLAKIIAI